MHTMTTKPSEFIQLHHASDQQLRAELSAGLLAASAYASPKYFYDALGSKLFAAICELPEYYLSRTEASIFDAYLGEIAEAVGVGGTLIDLGAGNCAKAARLFPALQPAQYVPVDISVDFLRDAVGDLQQRFPHIQMTGLGLDFSSALRLPDRVQRDRRTFFYPGSSISNFTPAEAVAFFRRLHAACEDDAGWRHVSFFNTAQSRIEMYLEARHAVTVQWQGGERRFQKGERIHTENSYKYTPEDFVQLLQQAGFKVTRSWNDANDWFLVCHARAM